MTRVSAVPSTNAVPAASDPQPNNPEHVAPAPIPVAQLPDPRATRAVSGVPPAGPLLAQLDPAAARAVRPRPTGRAVHPSEWDGRTRAAVADREHAARRGAALHVTWDVRSGSRATTTEALDWIYERNLLDAAGHPVLDAQGGVVQEHVDRPGQYVVQANGDRVLKLRLVFNVSAHFSGADPEALARDDRGTVWLAMIDRGTLKPDERVPLDWSIVNAPDPARPQRGVTVLAYDVACALKDPSDANGPHYLARVVDVDIPIQPGKVAVVMTDGNGTQGGAGPGGYMAGRVQIFFME